MVFSLLQSVFQILVEESLMMLIGDVAMGALREYIWDFSAGLEQVSQGGPGVEKTEVNLHPIHN
jgi:hypothetical protein